MSLLQSILMGVIQGLTEFLPVSSSGHLAIFKILFHVETDTGLLFDVLLHIGTLLAVFVVYYKDIIRLLGEKSIPIVVFVMTGLLCFLGVGSYQFIVAPLALGLLKKANISRNIGLVAMLVGANAVTYCLPGTSVTPNLMPTTILGTNIYAGAGVGIVAFFMGRFVERKKQGKGD